MLRFLGRMILIPLGIVLAAIVVLIFLGAVGMAQPGLADALASTAFKTIDRGIRTAFEGEEALKQFGWSLVALSRFGLVVLLLPVTLVAVVAEFFALRAWFFQALAAALLTAAMPYALLPEIVARGGVTSWATLLLAAAGALAGTIYWAIAGRSAGADPMTVEERATVKAPRVRR
jgi:ABC-type antimicrobial peptide transport system permease subunit